MTFLNLHESQSHFNCSDCNKACQRRSQLYIHQRTHINKIPLSCLKCKKEFSDAFTLNFHFQKSLCPSSKLRQHVCRICKRVYHCASTLALHKKTHFIQRPFLCTLCTAAFSTKRILTRHFQYHNNWSIPRCHLCGLVFSQQSTLRTHEFLLRCVYPHNCKICGQKFALRAQLYQHNKKHKTMQNGPFKCGLCDRKFFLRRTLIVHWRRHMANLTFACYLCPKKFYLKTCLASHLCLHASTDKKEDKSQENSKVDKSQSQKACLNPLPLSESKSEIIGLPNTELFKVISTSRKCLNDASHETSSKYQCMPSSTNDTQVEPTAEGMHTHSLKSSQNRIKDTNIPHKNKVPQLKEVVLKIERINVSEINNKKQLIQSPTKTLTFECNICKKAFDKNSSLKVHKQNHHSPKISNSNPISKESNLTPVNVSSVSKKITRHNFRAFTNCNSSMKIIVACSHCGERNFKSLMELEQHICPESKGKVYMCHICGMEFKNQCRLTAHILKHQHVKPCRVPCLQKSI